MQSRTKHNFETEKKGDKVEGRQKIGTKWLAFFLSHPNINCCDSIKPNALLKF